jgi:hypothetical protein
VFKSDVGLVKVEVDFATAAASYSQFDRSALMGLVLILGIARIHLDRSRVGCGSSGIPHHHHHPYRQYSFGTVRSGITSRAASSLANTVAHAVHLCAISAKCSPTLLSTALSRVHRAMVLAALTFKLRCSRPLV